ncbi:hypothetical protein F4776DRAFT_316341 [Hypoxylon sp. NC0597]|nr:hypothetical protein F4776DRAFT_316341 [Hypoxylon sp. NC0597]
MFRTCSGLLIWIWNTRERNPGWRCIYTGTWEPTPRFPGIYGNVTRISENPITVRATRPLNTNAHARLLAMVCVSMIQGSTAALHTTKLPIIL